MGRRVRFLLTCGELLTLGVLLLAFAWSAATSTDPMQARADLGLCLLALIGAELVTLGEYTRGIADSRLDKIAANTREVQARTSAHLDAITREREAFVRAVADLRSRQVH